MLHLLCFCADQEIKDNDGKAGNTSRAKQCCHVKNTCWLNFHLCKLSSHQKLDKWLRIESLTFRLKIKKGNYDSLCG